MKSFLHILLILFLLQDSAVGTPVNPLDRIIQSAVKDTMSKFFLKISNSQNSYSNCYEMIEKLFKPDKPMNQNEIRILKSLKTPIIYLIKNGIVFEFRGKSGFKVWISEDGQLKNESLSQRSPKSAFQYLFSSVAFAQGATVIGEEALATLSKYILPYLTKAIDEATVGAIAGCAYQMKMKVETQVDSKACKEGAYRGLMAVTTAGSAGAVSANSFEQFLLSIGIGGYFLSPSDPDELSNFSGSILQCEGDQGDFFLYGQKKDGTMGKTLYESRQDQIKFLIPGKGISEEKSVKRDQSQLEDFLKKSQNLPGVTQAMVHRIAEKVLNEISKFREECKENPEEGYTRKLWSSEGEVIQEPKNSSVAQ